MDKDEAKKSCRLEREVHSEFTPDGAWSERRTWIDESNRVTERRAAHVVSKVVPVVRSVGEIEHLRY